MIPSGKETGKKTSNMPGEPIAAVLMSATLSSGRTELADEVGEASLSGGTSDLVFLAGRPGWRRRLRFVFETAGERLLDDWRLDCAEQNAAFLWAALSMGFGAASYYALPDEPSFVMLLGVTLSLCFWLWRRACNGRLLFPLVIASMGMIGMTAASFHGTYRATPVLEKEISTRIVGQIEHIEQRGENGKTDERWTVKVEKIDKLSTDHMPKRLLLVRKSKGSRFDVGERVRMWARLVPLQRPAYPEGFYYGRYLWARGIGGQGYLGRSVERLPARAAFGLAALWEMVHTHVEQSRNAVASYILHRMKGVAGGLAVALSVGKRDYLDREVESALRLSGLAHILAISGLHMALVAMGIFWGVRSALAMLPQLALHYPIKQWAAAVALVCAGIYLVLSGSSVATIRAFLMMAIFLIAILVGRPALTMHNLALALLVIILLQPFGVVEPGMQMSFAATAALISSYDRIKYLRIGGAGRDIVPDHPAYLVRMLKSGLRGAGQWLLGIGTTALVAGLAVLPFSIIHFQQIAPLGLLANLLAMPIVSFIVMPMGLVSVLLAPFGLQSLPFGVLQWGLELVIASSRWVASIPDEQYMIMRGAGGHVGLIILALAIFAIHRRRIALFATIPVLVACILWATYSYPDLWVSEKGSRVAYRNGLHLWHLLGTKRATFDYKALLRSDGDARALGKLDVGNGVPAIQAGAAGGRFYQGCDASACIIQGLQSWKGERSLLSLALVRHPSAFDEECQKADIVISALPIPETCHGPRLIIGRDALRQYGAHFIRLKQEVEENGDAVWQAIIDTALPKGQRPWHPKNREPNTFPK